MDRERNITVPLGNLVRISSLVHKLLDMNKHIHRHLHFDCSMPILLGKHKCEVRQRDQADNTDFCMKRSDSQKVAFLFSLALIFPHYD